MKATFYTHYTTRALLRGGQRTILAICCVAVGVMAVVALQLVGFMLQSSISSNVRETNGGDIAVSATGIPLKASDLTFFDQLKSAGTITGYTALINANGSLAASTTRLFNVEAVDAQAFPLVDQPSFVQPSNSTVAGLLGNNEVIVTQNFLDAYNKQVGDTFAVYIKNFTGSGQTMTVKIGGVVANSGLFAQANNLVLVSTQDYLATVPGGVATYSGVDITTADQAHTDAALKAIAVHLPLASTQTVADVLNAEKSNIGLITNFLEITGLLSLLIGGVGIVNTMQVLLSRRKTEIAMLKTSGYHRSDLYLLFGLEAGLLGLIGGVLGSVAATGVSFLVRNLMEALGQNIPFVLNFGIIGGGVAIGCATALIFGLLPIVQAANVRPLSVIREQDQRGVRSFVQMVGLLVVLSVLFCGLATAILNNNVSLGVLATYGTFAVLLLLSAIFGLIVLVISKLPVPEHFQIKQVLLVIPCLVLSVLLYAVQPVFGICLLIASLLGLVVMMMPSAWKVSVKMALRNLGRRRARVTTTMVALFIGIFGIALVLGLGLNLQSQITTALAQNQAYNLVTTTSGQDTETLQRQTASIPGLKSSRSDIFTAVQPVAINGQSPLNALAAVSPSDRQQVAGLLSSIEGENLAASDLPPLTFIAGRNLNASDIGTNNVIISELLTSTSWLHAGIKLGDTITFASPDGKVTRTVTIVGIVALKSQAETMGRILAPTALVSSLATTPGQPGTVFYMNVDPTQLGHAEDTVNRIVPNAAVQDLTSTATAFIQQLNNILAVLVAIASLSVVAAVIIIANAVALAMLERRRELGILKSVGYTSGNILSEVLIENGIVGTVGAFIATLLASGGVVLLGSFVFSGTLTMPPYIVVSLILGAAALAIVTSTLVALGPVRVRPLAVLRYE